MALWSTRFLLVSPFSSAEAGIGVHAPDRRRAAILQGSGMAGQPVCGDGAKFARTPVQAAGRADRLRLGHADVLAAIPFRIAGIRRRASNR